VWRLTVGLRVLMCVRWLVSYCSLCGFFSLSHELIFIILDKTSSGKSQFWVCRPHYLSGGLCVCMCVCVRCLTVWSWSCRWSTVPPVRPWACCQSPHPPEPASGTRGTCSSPPAAGVWFCRASWVLRWRSERLPDPSSSCRRSQASWTWLLSRRCQRSWKVCKYAMSLRGPCLMIKDGAEEFLTWKKRRRRS